MIQPTPQPNVPVPQYPAYPQQAAPAPVAAAPVQPQQNAQQGNVIPDCTTMSKNQMKELRDSYQQKAAPREQVIVAGNLWFPHITSLIEGEELAEENKRRTMRGFFTRDAPYFSVRLNNPSVVYKDPANPTMAELYTLALFSMSNSKAYQGPFFARESTIKNLPYIAVATDATAKTFEQVYPKDEPENNTPAMIVMNTYNSNGHINLAVNGVLLCDPNVTFAGSSSSNRDVESLLANYGITLIPQAAPEGDADRYDPDSPEAEAMRAASHDMARDFPTAGVSAPAPAQPAPQPAYPAQPNYTEPAVPPVMPWTSTLPGGGIVQNG